MRQHGDPNRDYAGEWLGWRKEHGLTQEQEALALGLARKTIRDIEKGHRIPQVRSREKMAALQQRYREAQS